jgi:hypothetical protein
MRHLLKKGGGKIRQKLSHPSQRDRKNKNAAYFDYPLGFASDSVNVPSRET